MCPTDIFHEQIKGAKRILSAILRNLCCFFIETKFSEIFKVLGYVAAFGICQAVTCLI